MMYDGLVDNIIFLNIFIFCHYLFSGPMSLCLAQVWFISVDFHFSSLFNQLNPICCESNFWFNQVREYQCLVNCNVYLLVSKSLAMSTQKCSSGRWMLTDRCSWKSFKSSKSLWKETQIITSVTGLKMIYLNFNLSMFGIMTQSPIGLQWINIVKKNSFTKVDVF